MRTGGWKYIEPGPGPARNANSHIELGNNPEPQLYDVQADAGETRNLTAQHPQTVAVFGNSSSAPAAASPNRPRPPSLQEGRGDGLASTHLTHDRRESSPAPSRKATMKPATHTTPASR